MNEGARPARADDLPRLAELAELAIEELTPTRGGAVWAAREARARPALESLGAHLDDPGHLVLAGTIDGVVVGYAVVHVEPLRSDERLGVIDDLFVEEPAREVGVGEVLMDRILEWCRARSCSGVDALALPGNRETKNFFESFGFTARALVVHHRLGEEPS